MALSLGLLLLTGLILFWIKPHRFRAAGWLAAIPPALITAWMLFQMPAVAAGSFVTETFAWAPTVGLEISFRLDGLALLFGLIVAGMGAFVALYTGYYFEDDERQGYFYLLLFFFMASMLGLVWSDNLLALFCFWEGTSITSYLLIAFKTTSKTAREGARRAFIVTGLGGLAMLGGMILVGMATGTYSISGMIAAGEGFTAHPLYGWALALILLGAFTKSAQFPFHFWLPGAMAAPTPASAYLHSATMVKAGVFLLARMHPVMAGTPEWSWTVTTIGAITMLLGATTALRYTDLKAILAYATVSQLGMLTMLLGMPVKYAPTAVALGILAHSLYKGPMFLSAGIIDHATGERDIRRLAGLAKPLPWLALTVILAAYSMGGVPVSLGFVAKEYALKAGEHLSELWAAATSWSVMLSVGWTGAFFFAIAVMLVWDVFLRRRPSAAKAGGPGAAKAGAPGAEQSHEAAHVHHAPAFSFVLAALLPALLAVLLPFVLRPLNHLLIAPAAVAISEVGKGVEPELWPGITTPLLISLGALGLGFVFFLLRRPIRSGLQRFPAWLSGSAAFAAANDATYALARWSTRTVMGGSLAGQVSVTLLAASAVAIVVLIMEFDWGIVTGLVLSGGAIFYEVLLSALAIMAAVITVRAKSRLGAIISLGVVGWTVTLYFIAFSAPDLALTQLLIETLTVVLLVLAFFRIAPDKLPPAKRSRRIYRSVVAMAAGLFGFITVITVAVIQAGESISPYFERFSVPVGRGGNIVNVILVDFRGYDTMGEITVLAIAALGGAALLQAPRMAKLRAHFLKRLHKVSPGAPSGEAGAEAALSQAALAQAGSTGAAETTPSTKEARHG